MKNLLPFCLLFLFSCTKSDQPLIESQEIDPVAKEGVSAISASLVLKPSADAFIRNSQYAGTNYGTNTALTVKGTTASGYARTSYLKFSLGTVTGTVGSAKLRVYGRNPESTSSVTLSAFGASTDSWSETGITWNNAPATSGSALSSVSVNNVAKYYEIDVTAFVKAQLSGDKIASFVLKNPSNQNISIALNSRENSLYPPQLVISSSISSLSVRKPNHIFVVWYENKAYSQIIGSSNAPFINSLVAKGTLFTKSYAIYHPSYPNYITWFSGSNQGVTSDKCIDGKPFSAKNMYTALASVGRKFAWYSEGLPSAGSDVCSSGEYREKHNPTTIFKNVPSSANLPLTAMKLTDTSTFKYLPNVCVITPNMMNDMHDGTIRQGDDWLKAKFSKLIDWCMKNNSVFIVYYDEDNKQTDNRIPVVAVGQYIKAGYKIGTKFNHHSFSKAILVANGADTTFNSNVKTATSIQNIWK